MLNGLDLFMTWKTESYARYRASEKARETRLAYQETDQYRECQTRYNSSDVGKAVRRKYRDTWYKTKNGKILAMLGAARNRAKAKGISFAITKADIIIPEFCPLLGMKLSWTDFGIRYNSPSLDRKDSSRGYTPDNVWVISSRANILKNNATVDELELLVRNLREKCGST